MPKKVGGTRKVKKKKCQLKRENREWCSDIRSCFKFLPVELTFVDNPALCFWFAQLNGAN